MEGTTIENLPRRIGRYDVAARVAGGGSPIASEVFVATDSLRGSGKAVIIKRVAARLTREAAKAEAYLATAREVAKRLRHPNLVELRTVGADGNDVYLVMDYLQGETLARFLRELHRSGETLQTSTAAYIVAEACAGLDAAHRAELVHGHITPYDVFVGYDGTVKMLDVGVAAAKAAAASEGDILQVRDIEVQYSSPEVCRGLTADRRSDVFSVGAILWELLTGVSPFERTERAATMRAICDEAIAAPGAIRRDVELPGRMSEITMEALERDPEKRCADAGKLRQLLLGYVGSDKPARAELSRLMSKTFERRKADKATLAARVAAKAPPSEIANLDFTDEGLDLAHGADLDEKIPSGISASTGGAVTAGPKVVVPEIVPPSAPLAPDSTPRAKPPRVPFYDDDTEARRRRQEPTSLISRAGDPKSSETPPPHVAAKAQRKTPILAILGAALAGVVVTGAVLLVFVRKPPALPVAAKAVESTNAPASPSPGPTPSPSTPASAAPAPPVPPAPPEKTVLSIDTVPAHATISINGEKKGKAPLEVKLPKSTEVVVVEIQHPGYVTMKERVVPDVNQRLKLSLVASGAGRPTKPGPTNPYKKFE